MGKKGRDARRRVVCAVWWVLSSAACVRQPSAPFAPPPPLAPRACASAVAAPAATVAVPPLAEQRAVPPLAEQRLEMHGIEYVLRASRLTNLAWQLDCLAGFGRCSQAAYERLWRERLQAEPDLALALTRWRELRLQLRGPVGEHAESRSLLPVPQLKADLWQRVRLASVTASNEAEYGSQLYLLTNEHSAAALRSVLTRFDRAFSGIWTEALPVLQRAMAEQAALQRRDDVSLTIQRVAAFYGGNLGTNTTMHFDLLYRPLDPSADFATQLLDHGLIEVVPSAKPELRVQPPLHEMFHYLFASAPFPKLDDLASGFAASPDPNALAAYGLLDEVLATGLAQGIVGADLAPSELQARLAAPQKLYNDPFIDAVTKAFLPELRALLLKPTANGSVFAPEFQTAYLAAVKRAFPRGLPARAQLRPLAAAYSKELARAYEGLRGAAGPLVGSSDQPNSDDARSLLEDHRMWARVLLLKSSELGALHRYTQFLPPKSEVLLRESAQRNHRFAYATRASGSGPVYVLVADNDEQAQQLITELLALDAPFSGLALASPRTGS